MAAVSHHEDIVRLVSSKADSAELRMQYVKGKEAQAEMVGEVRALRNLAEYLASYDIAKTEPPVRNLRRPITARKDT